MKYQFDFINNKLEERKQENAFRSLKKNNGLIDFCSNDYLGFASEKEIHVLDNELAKYGATGSRLISGNHQITEEVEDYLADFYQAESALIFNSGYNANVGLFSSLPQRHDTIIYDELIHASIRDGIRLSHAKSYSFSHNNLENLKQKLESASGNIYIAVESVYSMDGDMSPLKEITELCKQHNAALIIDEAHAVGIYGKGLGLVAELNLIDDIFARVVTFGKALGTHGAAVLGNKLLKDYLINFSRAFIYTTALPLHSVLTIKKSHEFLKNHLERIEQLNRNIEYFQKQTQKSAINTQHSNSAIQCIIFPRNERVKQVAEKIQEQGFDVRPILSPTVPKGQERLRICLHSFNTENDINSLFKILEVEL